MFAFCVWDAEKRVAYLVRDRLGVKPLYYVSRACGLAFSSELRSLVRSGLCLPKLDESVLWGYLLYQFPPTDRTLISGAVRLPPGHLLEWRPDGTILLESYWDIEISEGQKSLSFNQAAGKVRDLLEESVAQEMLADVSVGCFLSGGLDSTIVASLMAKQCDQGLRTFSIGFPDSPDYDESAHAELVARAIGSDHTVVPFTEDIFSENVAGYIADIDEPLGDAAMYPTYLLAKRAAEDVKVVLTGEGADEVFGGYSYYLPLVEETRVRETFGPLSEIQCSLHEFVGIPFPIPSPAPRSPHSGFPYMTSPEFVWCMLHPERRPPLDAFILEMREAEACKILPRSSHTPLQRALYVDSKLWLANNVLTKLDKATMSHSLEARVPMLDHRLVELVFSLPDKYKVLGGRGKRLLREAARTFVPPEILARDKQGFGVPLDTWFRKSLNKFARNGLFESALVEDGILSQTAMRAILFSQQDLGLPLARLVWSLIVLDGWWQCIREEINLASQFGSSPVVSMPREPTVDIIIPVHEGLDLVRDCLRSISAFTPRRFQTLILDDGSCEATHSRLAELVANDPRFKLVWNPKSLGFLATCNRGISLSVADYVILLNSDTVVTPGWLEGLLSCAESDKRIAFVNPLTNESGNTSIRMAPGTSVFAMARKVRAESRRDYPALTTGVGMCMLICRSALNLLGPFDPIYLDAYCEESDLCMRFTESGFRVVAADDVYIYHKGLGSHNEPQRKLRYERNRKIFDQRWELPFLRDWSRYLAKDPLQAIRHRSLKGTITPGELTQELIATIEAKQDRLDTSNALSACADGRHIGPALSILPQHLAWGSHRDALREWAVGRLARPAVQFDERALSYPTRKYVNSLPKCPPDKLRITFLISSLSPAGGVISIVQLAREMLFAGHDVKFVTDSPEINPEQLNLCLQPLVYRDPDHLIRDFPESDIVVATFWATAHRYMRALRQRYSFLSVYFIQDYEAWFYPATDYEHRRDVVRSYATTEHHIVKSQWLADKVNAHGVTCDIIPLGLDLSIFYPRHVERPPSPRVVSLAAPGAEKVRRGFRETIEIFRRLHEQRPDAELIFFGAEQRDMPPLPFPYQNMGSLDQRAVAQLFSTAHVLVDASHWQGFGRPGLEAMACATVPVLTNLGGLHEYARDRENCLLVSPGDTDGAVTAILQVIEDRRLQAKLRKNGPRTACKFSHEIEAKRHIILYRQWIEDKVKPVKPSPLKGDPRR